MPDTLPVLEDGQMLLSTGLRDADGLPVWQVVSVSSVLAIETVQQLLEAAIARGCDYTLLGELMARVDAVREASHA